MSPIGSGVVLDVLEFASYGGSGFFLWGVARASNAVRLGSRPVGQSVNQGVSQALF
jgi:hypothetical protein